MTEEKRDYLIIIKEAGREDEVHSDLTKEMALDIYNENYMNSGIKVLIYKVKEIKPKVKVSF